MNNITKKNSRWPIVISIIYISFMLVFIGIVIFSTFNKVDLVTENYYEQEIKYQQQIDRINRTDSLSVPVNWYYDKNKRQIKIQFPEEINFKNVEGNILFFRPSDAKQDKVIALHLSSENSQTISTQHLVPGLWKLKIFWQVMQTEFYTEGTLII